MTTHKNNKLQSIPAANISRRKLLHSSTAGLGYAVASTLLPGIQKRAYSATQEYDVVVVGSGAAGMTAALAAAKRGLKTIVLEKAPHFGGSTARSGGGIWIRNNEVILQAGVRDSYEKAVSYMQSTVGSRVPKSRQLAFLDSGPDMISFVMRNSPLQFRWMEGYSEYYPERPGGLVEGSSIEPEILDGNILGDDLALLNAPYIPTPPGVVIYAGDYKWLSIAAVNAYGVAVATKAAARYASALLRGRKALTMGQALAAGLRAGLKDAGVTVQLNAPLVDLEFNHFGRASGVVVRLDGRETLIQARRGVILASGGFEHNAALRREFQRSPIGSEWTVGAKSNTGDGIVAGLRAGASLDLMDDAWWGPAVPLPDQPYFCLSERSLPGSLMVNTRGQRFVNESAPYHDVVNAMYETQVGEPDVGVWLIADQRYRNRYVFRDILPALPFPKDWYESGAVQRDWSLSGLAKKIGVPAGALTATVERFNQFAQAGVDADYRRGASAYDHHFSDPSRKPNPSLARLGLAPFYAFKIVPGDLGTKGGLNTDARSRVLRRDNSVIPGLYAAGNVSASVMGHSYPAAGATLGPAMTFAYIAANDLADSAPN